MLQTERDNLDPGRRYLEREFKIACVASLEPRYFELLPAPDFTPSKLSRAGDRDRYRDF